MGCGGDGAATGGDTCCCAGAGCATTTGAGAGTGPWTDGGAIAARGGTGCSDAGKSERPINAVAPRARATAPYMTGFFTPSGFFFALDAPAAGPTAAGAADFGTLRRPNSGRF